MLRLLQLQSKNLFSAEYLKSLQKLHNQDMFHEILGLVKQPPSSQLKNRVELRKKYLELIKKYHSDKCHNDPQKANQYSEISKIIISAYQNIQKAYFPQSKSGTEYMVEDAICQELFGKKYDEAKYWMYKQGNQKIRQTFLRELARRTGTQFKSQPGRQYQQYYAKEQTFTSPKSTPQSTQSQKSSNSTIFIGLGIVTAVLAGLYSFSSKDSRESKQYNNTIDYSSKIQEIYDSSAAKAKEKSNAMIQSLMKDQPPSLCYPKQQPDIFTQLIKFSIAPDIHLFQIPPQYFSQQFISNKDSLPDLIETSKFPLQKIKVNTTLTLSLEAQRAFHNVYVKVKDVINQIEQTGSYKPPKVLFRFHGYVMAEIRDKSLSLRNYKDTEYISLFDLYFDYYSCIFLKKDQYSHYLVGKDDQKLFGWVHFNNRKCNPVYLSKGQKYAYFVAPRKQYWEILNKKIWGNYYKNYQDKWRS